MAVSEVALKRTGKEKVAKTLATVVSSASWVGGPISNILNQYADEKWRHRFCEVVAAIEKKLEDHVSDESKHYVEQDDFEELLAEVMDRAVRERTQEKRDIYARLVSSDIKNPGQNSYEDKLRFVRTIEALTRDQLRLLAAVAEPAGSPQNSVISSPLQVLQRRLPDLEREHIEELANDLNSYRLTELRWLNTMMTPPGAEDTRSALNDFGKRFVAYLGG